MSKAVLVSALLAGGALLLAATLFQPTHAPEPAAPCSPLPAFVAELAEQPSSPADPSPITPSPAEVSEASIAPRAPVRERPPAPHGSVRLSGYVRIGASERNRGEPVPDAVVRLVPDSSQPPGFHAVQIWRESTGEPRDQTSLTQVKDLGRAVTDANGRFDL